MMARILAFVALACLSLPALAADNFIVTQTGGQPRTKAAQDIGGDILADKTVVVDATGDPVFGEVTASPTANTIGDRLKTINTTLGSPLQAGGAIALPSGASTATLQTSGNASLTSIDTKLTGNSYAQASTTSGQVGRLIMCAASTAAPVFTTGLSYPFSCTLDGRIRASFTGSNPAGAAVTLAADTSGVLDSPRAGTCDATGTNGCRETRTNLAANTPAVICPATAGAITQEIQIFTAPVGISLSGSMSLNTVTPGASLSLTPTFVLSTSGLMYTMPVPQTNDVTAITSSTGYVVCVTKKKI